MSPDNRLPKPPQDVSVRQDPSAWKAGFDAAQQGKPAMDCPYGARSVEALSWTSGFIEGKASPRPARCDGQGS